MQLNGLTNIGLRDQWKALEWINENIGAFGGDKDRVTIWGESAGAMSVASLSEAYGGDNKGLWRGGIMASGSFIYPYSTLTAQQTLYDNVTKELDCYYAIDSLQCLRNTSFEKLNATFYALDEGQDFTPYVDGEFIVNGPLYNFANKKVAPINFITGCNSDEGLIFTGVAPNTSIEVSTFLQSYFDIDNATAYEMMSVYPLDGPLPPYSVSSSIDWVNLTAAVGVYTGTQTRRLYGIFGDYEFHVGRRMTASSWNSITGKHAYSYRFDTDVTRFPLVVTPGLGVGFSEHGAELSFEFRLPYVSPTPYPPLPNITSMQRESYAMQACWASFAATGSPNNHGLSWIPYWPAYDESPSNFVFNATINDTLNLHIEDDNYRVKQLKWWDEHLRMWTF
ncbi:MAG: hypothetical protein M1834_005709 [Cirrosporium novae-zelandiae]|nr:MAG: hypothetical protein M1834_005709 [Cirrosporium novae-zelandiae]